MICFFLLFIALQSQNTHGTLVTKKPDVPTRSVASRRTKPCDLKSQLADFATAVQLAMRSLDKGTYLYEDLAETKLPASIESISILDDKGKVKDSTIIEFIDKSFTLPSSGETKEHEYYIQLNSTLGIRWIIIKTKAK